MGVHDDCFALQIKRLAPEFFIPSFGCLLRERTGTEKEQNAGNEQSNGITTRHSMTFWEKNAGLDVVIVQISRTLSQVTVMCEE